MKTWLLTQPWEVPDDDVYSNSTKVIVENIERGLGFPRALPPVSKCHFAFTGNANFKTPRQRFNSSPSTGENSVKYDAPAKIKKQNLFYDVADFRQFLEKSSICSR